MTDRIFRLTDSDLISCDTPCEEKFATLTDSSKSLPTEYKGIQTKRCVANSAALRGQHFAEQQHPDPKKCRVCTIYTATPTTVDSASTEA